MKVLFINAYDVTGGAAIAGYRLYAQLQRQYSLDVRMLAGTKRSNDPTVSATVPPGLPWLVERGTSYILSRLGLQYKFIPFSTRTIISAVHRMKPDVIHLHNIHGGYFQISLLKKLSRLAPIVWTLHDMWAFTANAAHTFGNDAWKRMGTFPGEKKLHPVIGLPTGPWLLREKKKIYAQSNLTVVTPSRWLHDLAVQSPVFEAKTILHIPNGVDIDRYQPLKKAGIRQSLNIPVDAKVLFFSSEKIDRGDFKGGKLLLDILRIIHEKIDDPVHLIMMGEGGFPELASLPKFVLHATGYIRDEETMIRCINASDLLLYPTKADNLPNVLVESIACGVPAVTFDIGGCREIIDDRRNGFLIPPFDKELFASRTIEFLRDGVLRQEFSSFSRSKAMGEYSLSGMASRYYALYQELAGGVSR